MRSCLSTRRVDLDRLNRSGIASLQQSSHAQSSDALLLTTSFRSVFDRSVLFDHRAACNKTGAVSWRIRHRVR